MDEQTRNIIQSEETLDEARSGVSKAKSNIRSGLTMFLLSVMRMFVESWIVMEIWNRVLVDVTPVTALTYWQTFFGLLMVRILTGQIKIKFER